jgi:hypothetical protein
VVVDTHGPIDMADPRANAIARIGVDLSERAVGTTAIGAALSELQPVWLHRGEHFFHATSCYSCAGAPLFGPDGQCVGMLDLTGIDASERPELKHLVAQSARSIENALALSRPHKLVLRLNWPGRLLGDDDDGIVCLDRDGWVTGSNGAARQMLAGLTQAGGGAVHCSELFAQPWEPLYDIARAGEVTPVEVPLWSGLRLSCLAQVAGSARTGAGPRLPLRDVEIALIRKAVSDARGNVMEAARSLGISRATVYRKLSQKPPGARVGGREGDAAGRVERYLESGEGCLYSAHQLDHDHPAPRSCHRDRSPHGDGAPCGPGARGRRREPGRAHAEDRQRLRVGDRARSGGGAGVHRPALCPDARRRPLRGAAGRRPGSHVAGRARRPGGPGQPLHLCRRPAGAVEPRSARGRRPGQRAEAGAPRPPGRGRPLLAPYGMAANQTLVRLGVLPAWQTSLLQGESVAQAYQFVATGSATLGFIALSQVMSEGRITRGSGWIVPSQLHDPLRQEAVLLNAGRSNPAATALMDYLKTDQARAVLRAYGYEVPKP